MSKANYRSEVKVGDGQKVMFSVVVLLWKEDAIHYAMSPSLDITGYGRTEEEAQKSFEVMAHEFMLYTHRKKTIYTELERLGWTINKKKRRVKAPDMLEMLEDNEELKEVINRPYTTREHAVHLML